MEKVIGYVDAHNGAASWQNTNCVAAATSQSVRFYKLIYSFLPKLCTAPAKHLYRKLADG